MSNILELLKGYIDPFSSNDYWINKNGYDIFLEIMSISGSDYYYYVSFAGKQVQYEREICGYGISGILKNPAVDDIKALFQMFQDKNAGKDLKSIMILIYNTIKNNSIHDLVLDKRLQEINE